MRIGAWCVMLSACCAGLAGCGKAPIERVEWPVMGTVAAVQSRNCDGDVLKRAVADVKEVFAQIESLLNAHNPQSELSRLAVCADDEILNRCNPLVRDCYLGAFRVRNETGGRFDPRWKGPGTLDLGAIAKGYAVDLAYEKVKDCGAELLIDLGGNLKVVSGTWKVGIAGSAQQITLTNAMACATSAEYFRGSHIRDARTSRAPVSRLYSVTVVHPTSAMAADALSTVMFIYGKEQGNVFLNRYYPMARALWQAPLSHFFELMHARSSSRVRFGAGAR
jgi:thiamine biosynthesis lipoprotein ApbE